MIKNYFILAWRNLLRNKVYSFINITGLSIGLACCMLIILYNNDEVSYDRFNKNANNIYRITNARIGPDGKEQGRNGITGMMPGPAFKNEIPEVKEFVRLQGEQLPVKVGTEIFEQEAMYADENFFNVFSFPLKEGNRNQVLKDMYSVVLNEEVAKKFFGTGNVIGKTIELPLGTDHDGVNKDNKFETFTISGVVPVSPQNSSIKIQMLLPMKLNLRQGREDKQWINFYLNTFVVLHPDADVKKVEKKFKKVYEANAAEEIKTVQEKFNMRETIHYGLQPLLSMHLSTDYAAQNGLVDGSNPIYSKILGGIALFMLLIACINFVNLTVARSLKRAKEIGVRKVIGGERKQLIAQFLGESFVLSFFSFVLAIVLVMLVLPLFNSLSNKVLSFSYLLNAELIWGYVALFIVTSLLAGFYPALVLSGFNPVQTLYNRMPLSGKNYLSKSLVVLQFTLTTFLIIATITIYSQFNYLTKFELGYNDKNLVLINTDRMKADKVAVFRSELMKNPSVQSIAVRQRGQWGTIAKVNGEQIEFAMDVIDHAFLPVLEIPVVQGRNFSVAFPLDSTQSVLVNEAFVKKAGWKEINNKQVDFFYDSIKYNVVGVVKDYHYASLMEEIKPQLFIMHPKYSYGQLLVKIKPQQTSATLNHIEKVFKAQMPFIPYKYDFKDAINVKQYASDEKWKQIIFFAACLTIFISCIGLFGLAALAAEKRTKEIGIRKVLGASATNITTKLSGSFVKLVLIAALLAFPAAWWAMNKWLQNYPYRITMDIWVFVCAGVTVLMIALFTISFQSIKAAVANPVKSLRTE
jgi:putative ABC transport system permease protein